MPRPIYVVDIGANPIDETPPYKPLLQKDLCKVIGFEPQNDALIKLHSASGPNESYYPYCIGDGSRHTLYECYCPGMTSLLEPDPDACKLFQHFFNYGKVIKTRQVQTQRLDDVEEIPHIDFLKIDAQGSELSVFRNGRNKLRETVVIHTEVSFMPLYKNQPMFCEVDEELRMQGFIPHFFDNIKSWPFCPPTDRRYKQLLEADIVYIKDISHSENLTTEQLERLLVIMHHCYDSNDLVKYCGAILEERY